MKALLWLGYTCFTWATLFTPKRLQHREVKFRGLEERNSFFLVSCLLVVSKKFPFSSLFALWIPDLSFSTFKKQGKQGWNVLKFEEASKYKTKRGRLLTFQASFSVLFSVLASPIAMFASLTTHGLVGSIKISLPSLIKIYSKLFTSGNFISWLLSIFGLGFLKTNTHEHNQ